METNKRLKISVLTGAGISADSGLETFRDSGGLWAKYRIEDVCTPEALRKNPALVLEFYNARRRQLKDVSPNSGHKALVDLEKFHDVTIITQNVDDLHERAGSSKIIHLHGELLKCRSIDFPEYVTEIHGDLNLGDLCPKGSQLRPHIVFFGEEVPAMAVAEKIVSECDVLIIAGTSLAVYPAAGLVYSAPSNAKLYLVDPSDVLMSRRGVTHIKKRAAEGLPELLKILSESRY